MNRRGFGMKRSGAFLAARGLPMRTLKRAVRSRCGATVFLPMLIMAVLPGHANATEGGGTSKPLGQNTVMSGVMPPPGSLRSTTTFAYYDANDTLDGNGEPRAGISNFHATMQTATLRFQYVWSDVEVFNANLATSVGIAAYVHATRESDVKTPAGTSHRQGSASGIGDLRLTPVSLGWHADRVHQIAGFDIFLPTANYNPEQLVNVGRGNYTIAPAYWITWFPIDEVEADLNIFYLYNFENPNTNYRGGNEISTDYALGYAITPMWQAGISGYAYKQVTDDQLNGKDVPGGNKGQVLGIGPYVRYHPSKDWGITLKWLTETMVENRSQGNRFLLQFALKLW